MQPEQFALASNGIAGRKFPTTIAGIGNFAYTYRDSIYPIGILVSAASLAIEQGFIEASNAMATLKAPEISLVFYTQTHRIIISESGKIVRDQVVRTL